MGIWKAPQIVSPSQNVSLAHGVRNRACAWNRAFALRVGSSVVNRNSGEGRSPEGDGGDSPKAGSDRNAIALALGVGTNAAGLR